MKTIGLILILLTLSFTTLLAQDEFEFKVVEESRDMTKGTANALVVNLPNTNYKEVNKLWSKYLKSFRGRLKYNRRVGEYFSDNAEIKEMSDNAVDIISRVYDNGGEGTTIAVWFNLGVTYLSASKYPERYSVGEKILKDFSLLVSEDMIEAQLKEEEKEWSNMQSILKGYEKDQSSAESNIVKQKDIIAKAKASITASEKDVENSLANQEEQKGLLKEQAKVIETIKRKLKAVKK
ncbi:MAG: hypothetical protein AB8E82_03355 [Aureispira sp.]